MSETFDNEVVTTKLVCSVRDYKAIAPINRHSVLLFSGDELFVVSPEGKELLMNVQLPAEEDAAWCNRHLTPRLIVSPDARFCAIVNDYGRYGVVVDLQSRTITLHLDRGAYHPETQPFPAAFAVHQDRCVLIHGTDWNRVDVSDAATGKLLIERAPTSYVKGEERPEHYLDYFHGRLHVSPGSEWILDDGWVWQPFGAPSSWSLKDWLENNIWEAEDGPSHKQLCWRDYHWDVPMTFLDNHTVAISGLGDDDEEMEPGARVFDVRSGEEINSFAGPSGLFFSDGQQLLSSEANGLHFWDVHKGVLSDQIESFRPQFQIPGALMQIEDDLMHYWSLTSNIEGI